jgi:hypothetical protein
MHAYTIAMAINKRSKSHDGFSIRAIVEASLGAGNDGKLEAGR